MLSHAMLERLEALELLRDLAPRWSVRLPMRVESRANQRLHWRALARAGAKQRQGAHLACVGRRAVARQLLDETGLVVRVVRRGPRGLDGHDNLVVRVVRRGPRGLDGHDNLGAALKAVIDGVADMLGVPDNDSRVTFVPDAELGPYAVEIEFYARRSHGR